MTFSTSRSSSSGQADRSINAFHNVCPHQATALAVGCGRFFFEGYHIPQTHPQLAERTSTARPGNDLQNANAARAQDALSRAALGL